MTELYVFKKIAGLKTESAINGRSYKRQAQESPTNRAFVPIQ